MALLLIDNNTADLAPLLSMLGNAAATPHVHFASGVEAITHLHAVPQHEPFSLVCLSLSLEDMPWEPICRFLKQHDLCMHSPLVALAEQSTVLPPEQLALWGIDDVYHRPFDADGLASRLTLILKLAHETQQRLFYENRLARLGIKEFSTLAESLLHPLSSLPNRVALQYYVRQFNHTNAKPLSFIALGIDSYGEYLAAYGADKAEKLCRQIAALVAATPAPLGSAVFHYEPHVLVVMLPDTPQDEAMTLANTLRRAVSGLGIAHGESLSADFITLSAGIGRTDNTAYTPVSALATAFMNLDRAIRSGGNHAVASMGVV